MCPLANKTVARYEKMWIPLVCLSPQSIGQSLTRTHVLWKIKSLVQINIPLLGYVRTMLVQIMRPQSTSCPLAVNCISIWKSLKWKQVLKTVQRYSIMNVATYLIKRLTTVLYRTWQRVVLKRITYRLPRSAYMVCYTGVNFDVHLIDGQQ